MSPRIAAGSTSTRYAIRNEQVALFALVLPQDDKGYDEDSIFENYAGDDPWDAEALRK